MCSSRGLPIIVALAAGLSMAACSDSSTQTPKDLGPDMRAKDSAAADRQAADRQAAEQATPDTNSADIGAEDQTASEQGVDAGMDRGLEDAGASDVGVSCTPGTRQCANDVAEVCVTAGNAWNRRQCATGCESGECKPTSLELGWKVHQFNLTDDGITIPASYSFEQNGLVALQSANPMASVYYKDEVLPEGIRITGSFAVETVADDDLVGFVFGWQDSEHFYLFDWKQGNQPDATCGTAKAGAALKVANASAPMDKCMDFWSSDGTTKVKPLVNVDQNPDGWKDNTVYDLELIFRPGDIKLTIKEGANIVVSITSSDTTYRSGKFGFYNYSQEQVRYRFFAISPVQ